MNDAPERLSDPTVPRAIEGRSIVLGRALAAIALGVVIVALLGWWVNAAWLTHFGAPEATMKAATSLGIVCVAIGVLLADPSRRWVALVFGTVTLLIGATGLLRDFAGLQLSIHDFIARLTPGERANMSPVTSVELVLLGSALATIDLRFGRFRPSHWLAVLAGLIALLAITGHVYGARSLYAVEGFTTKSRPAAIAVILTATGMLCVRPRAGFMALLTGSSVASASARRMLPLVLVVPLCLGWLRLQGQHLGWYGTEFGVAMLALSCGVSLASLLAWSTRGLLRAEEHRTVLQHEVELRRIEREAEIVKRQLERELSARDRQLAGVLDAVPAGVVVRTGEGELFYRNAEAFRILESEPPMTATLQGTTDGYQLLVAGTNEIYPLERLPMARALAGEESTVTDLELVYGDKRIALQVHGTPIFDEARRVEFAVAAFVDIQKLRKQAFEDPLTGLVNRAGFVDAFSRVRSLCARADQRLAVALVDLDRFKAVNDDYGHAVGDDVLRGVAECLAASVRDTDVVARWGGEEIAVLLPAADGDAAVRTVERLLDRVRALEFHADAATFRVSFSAGVTEIVAADVDLFASLERADRALYAAKAAGRSAVRLELSSHEPAVDPATCRRDCAA